MGSLTNFPIDQVDSIGVDIEVNNLSDEHFRDVMEELTNHQIPEREKCPLVRRLNASISGYFKSTGDVGFSKMSPNNSKGNGDSSIVGNLPGSCGNNVAGSVHGFDDGNSIELVEYRRTFELKNYHSPKGSNSSDIKSKSSERTKGSDGSSVPISTSSSSSVNNCKIPDSPSSSFNLNRNGSSVDSFVNFDSLKRPPSEPTNEPAEDASLNSNITTNSNTNTISSSSNSNLIVNNNSANDSIKDATKDNSNSSSNNGGSNVNNNNNNNNNSNSNSNSNSNNNNNNNNTTNNTKGNRSASNAKSEKKKKSKKGETVYTAQDIDGHIGDQSIDDLVYYVTGNKGEVGSGSNGGVTGLNIASVGSVVSGGINIGSGGSVCGSTSSENKLTVTSKNNKDANSGGKVKKKEKSSSSPTSSSVNNSTSIQGRNKKGSNNSSNTNISTSSNNFNSNNFNNANSSVNCASTNGNASDNDVKNFGHNNEKTICYVDSGLGKSIPRSSSATTFDSKFSPSNVAQSEVSSSLDASPTSPILSKSQSTESSSSTTSIQPVTKLISGTGIMAKSKVRESATHKESNNNNKSDINTANGDLENSYIELRYAASDSEMADQETSFQTVKSKHLKRRKGASRNKGDLRMSSPLPRTSNIFTNSSSSTSTTPSVTSSIGNSVSTSMTARGYESEREYCADEYRRRKEYLHHRKLASSMPHSEQNSADNSDMESSCSYPVSGRMPILPTPPGPPASSGSISSTPKVSYADIAKMGSVIGVTPSIGVAKGPQSANMTLNSSKLDNNNNSCTGKDNNNNINNSNISGSIDTNHLPVVIMNDDSDATDEIESPFTFGFFDDVTSSNLTMNSSFASTTNKVSDSPVKKFTATTTTSPSSTILKSSITNINIKSNDNISLSYHVKSKNASSSTLTFTPTTSAPTVASSSTDINSTLTYDSTLIDTPRLAEAVLEAPKEIKVSGKDPKTSSNDTSLEKFIAIKLAEPPTNMDADINTFNYSQIINFIKTAWESVMCQYHRSPDKNNSRGSSKGANLFRESTTYYKELISP